jgi:inhibitor of Bruton tyrosine kinase
MSHLLWKHFWENDVDKFRRLLAPGGQNSQPAPRNSLPRAELSYLSISRSPTAPATPPRSFNKNRRASGHTPGTGSRAKDPSAGLGKAEVNSRDHAGLTLLLRAASSTESNAHEFVQALLEHPAIDLYAQDPESGWNALHRALYFGNVTTARALLKKERDYLTSHHLSSVTKVGTLIKTKDHEGNSPFDVYNSTIATRSLQDFEEPIGPDDASESGGSVDDTTDMCVMHILPRADRRILTAY